MAISTTVGDAATGWRAVLHRWPTALGLTAVALQLALGPDAETVTTVTIVALLCYLGAAALNRRWVAWAGCAVLSVLVAASQILELTWWAVATVVALVLVVTGLVLRVPRPPLTAQTAALVGYGVIAVIALYLSPRVGLALAGVALAGHGVWDVIHYRRNQVVHRSLAEFCVVLDVPLGAAAIILAITG